jgi:predicted SnoaL-like aldol condensation-catalyzing enzyme
MSPARMDRYESAIRTVLEFQQVFNRRDAPRMMELVSEDYIYESSNPAPDGSLYEGKEAAAKFWREFFLKAPSASVEVEEVFSTGMRCIVRWKYSLSNSVLGEDSIRGVDIFRVRNGAICEQISYIKGACRT